MIFTSAAPATRRGILLAGGLSLGVGIAMLALTTSWENVALVLGIGLAALVGLAQTCSA